MIDPSENNGAGQLQRAADRERWIFSATPITWRRWVVTWELDQLDGFSKHNVLENITLLPS